MSFDKVSPYYNKTDNEINVIIEIPANSVPVKYEVDKKTNLVHVDRFLTTCMYYPINYGYINNTLAEDDDPLDVLVHAPYPLISGTVIACRPIGMLNMLDNGDTDNKILALPIKKITNQYNNIKDIDNFSKELKQMIEHFFKHYKGLEENKLVVIKENCWHDKQAAIEAINCAVAHNKTVNSIK